MKKVLFAFTALIITSLACGMQSETVTQRPTLEPSATNVEVTESVQGGFLLTPVSPTNVSEPASQNSTSGPNLELSAYLQNTADIGNGQKRLTIAFNGKNASNDWYSYYLFDSLGECSWLYRNTLLLKTEQGNTYTPAVDSSISCGAQGTYLTAPGSTISWVGDELTNIQGWWGWITFDVPQNATPKEISMTYGSLDAEYNHAYGTVTTPILPISEFKKTDKPFDSQLSDNITIVRSGDKIQFADLATFSFQTTNLQPDGSFNISLQIISTDQDYPLNFNPSTKHNFTYLLYQDGATCCMQGSFNWIQDINLNLGPLQTISLPSNNFFITAPNPNHYKVWLVGDFSIVETNGGSKADKERFAVELTNPAAAPVSSDFNTEIAPSPTLSSSATGLNGTWQGDWTNPAGYLYTCEIILKVDQSNNIDGYINWILQKSPRADEQAKIGLSAREYVKGTYDPQTRLFTFSGYEKDDLYSIIGLDNYKLTLSADNNTLSGITEDNGPWDGQITATSKP